MADDQRSEQDEREPQTNHNPASRDPEKFALEIEHMPNLERTGPTSSEPNRVYDRDEDPLEDPDRKRKPSIEGDGPASSQAQEPERPAKAKNEAAPDRSFPAAIDTRFYVTTDRLGRQHVYADSKGTAEIFQETETKLQTKSANPRSVALMIDTAAHREWDKIKVSGEREFRREAWLEGQARGIQVEGYKPNDLDRQELAKREQKYLQNEIAPDGDGKQLEQTERGDTARGEPGSPVEQSRTDRTTHDYQQGIEGVVVNQGTRPYQDNPKNSNSPYVVLETDRGQETVWGAGLPDALEKSGTKEGDLVRLHEAGMERVKIRVPTEVDGKTVQTVKEVDRRSWDATVIESRESTRALEDERNEPDKVDGQAREDKINQAEVSAERARIGAEKTLNTGAACDVAVEEGGYANENRAREYMANGRNISAASSELKGAATMEAYVERQLKQKFPDDPMAVSRTMDTARNKIGQMIARG